MNGTIKILTCLAVLAPCFVTSGVVTSAVAGSPNSGSPDTDSFAGTAAVTISNHGGVTAKPLASFDISFVDPTLGLYALGDRTNNGVDLVDTNTNAFLGFCGQGKFVGVSPGGNDTSGPDGVLIRDHKEIWAGDGDSSVKVFNVAGCNETTAPTHVISTVRGAPGSPLQGHSPATDKRADEMCYDPRDNLIMVANNAADPPYGSLISTTSYSVVGQIVFDGTNGAPKSTNGAEQCQWSARTGKFYITIPGVETPNTGHGVVAVISPQTKMVETTFDIPLASCDTPQGMAVGPDHDILVGCNGPNSTTHSSVIIDERNGKIRATVANESGPDEVWFNPGNNHYFLARSAPASGEQSLGIIDAETRVADTSIPVGPVGKNAHSVAADSVTNKTFYPIPGAIGGSDNRCSNAGGSDASGCILVVTGKNDKDDKRDHGNDCVASGAPVITASRDDHDTQFMRGRCDDDRR
jgi:hypothetical protein